MEVLQPATGPFAPPVRNQRFSGIAQANSHFRLCIDCTDFTVFSRGMANLWTGTTASTAPLTARTVPGLNFVNGFAGGAVGDTPNLTARRVEEFLRVEVIGGEQRRGDCDALLRAAGEARPRGLRRSARACPRTRRSRVPPLIDCAVRVPEFPAPSPTARSAAPAARAPRAAAARRHACDLGASSRAPVSCLPRPGLRPRIELAAIWYANRAVTVGADGAIRPLSGRPCPGRVSSPT